MSTSRSVVHHLSPSVDGAYCDMKAVIKSGDELVRCYFADNDLIAAGAILHFQRQAIVSLKTYQ